MWLILDLETENHEYYGQLASPFHPENYIVAPGWALNDGPIQSRYFHNRAEADASDWFNEAVKDATVLTCHNATFEIQWLLSRHKESFMAFLKRGGRIFCTQYAQYLLSHQTMLYPSLDETAPMYGGTTKIDEVKLMWEQGYLTSQIDQALLLKYLAGPEGDIVNTRLACFGQYTELLSKGMIEMFWHRMDSLLFNAVCTFNGLFVDGETAKRNHAEQLARAAELRETVMSYLPADTPAELREQFNLGSDYQLSAFLFGGPIKYDVKVQYDPPKYEKADFYKCGSRYIKVDDWAALSVELQQEFEGTHGWREIYKAGKNKGQAKVFREDTDIPKLKWGEAIYEFEGLIRLNTLPPHVQEMYLGKRAEYRSKRFLCDRETLDDPSSGREIVLKEGTPVYSTSKDSLDLLANFTDIAKPLKELNQLDKDNGTYYITYTYDKEGNVKSQKGMLQYVNPDGIIHHRLNGTATVTTRLSSSDPNL